MSFCSAFFDKKIHYKSTNVVFQWYTKKYRPLRNLVDMDKFIGRIEELNALNSLLDKKSASLVTVQGRRRIGKSRLIEEFAKNHLFYEFLGIAPHKGTTAKSQRAEFARQLRETFNLASVPAADWGDLFTTLSKQTEEGRIIILLDEISWMGSMDPDFLGKLKTAWDKQFKKNPELILILCGSISSWIEKNIINSTAFVGRPSLYLKLEELSLSDCNKFWAHAGGVSYYEKFKLLSVTGGVPRYLELINPKLSAEENIKRLCFSKHGPLVNEFEFIFSDVFSKKHELYRRIVEELAKGRKAQEELRLKKNLTGDLSEVLNDLVLAGFIARDFTWNIKNGKISKLSFYRLRDNYVRFYLKYILPNKPQIEKNEFQARTLTALPGWDAIMGLQFENLVINNSRSVIEALGIQPEEVVFNNPFFQRTTNRQLGCQIDFLIQTRFSCVYVCEIKFQRFEIGPEIIQEMQQKIERLKLPKHFSYRPVLIHVNGVREDVVDSEYFSNILDFSRLFATSARLE